MQVCDVVTRMEYKFNIKSGKRKEDFYIPEDTKQLFMKLLQRKEKLNRLKNSGNTKAAGDIQYNTSGMNGW